MPLKVARFCTSVLLLLTSLVLIASAQTASSPATSPSPAPSTSGDVMRERISKAKAFIAVRNYNAAIYELESIRKESSDAAVHGVVNVLLMNSYLEQGDYKRAQDFLNETFKQQKTTKPNAGDMYMAVASQVVKGARSRAERYRALGLNISDRLLPLEALNDLEKMRETVEIVIAQSKEIGKTPTKASDAMMLLEEATNSRTMLARDDYDARKWKDEVADTREAMANSRSVVLSAVQGEPSGEIVKTEAPKADLVASTSNSVPPPVVMQPVVETKKDPQPQKVVKAAETEPSTKTIDGAPAVTAADEKQPEVVPPAAPKNEPVAEPTPARQTAANSGPSPAPVPAYDAVKNSAPMEVGSLIVYATRQATPTYPAAARVVRAAGIVRVDVTIDEEGDVAEVHKASGPPLLQAAARDAIKKWKFKPFLRDGQPVKANGFINFNFAL